MSSGESGESLASRLADAEAALLFARVNEKRLSEENSRYRERCEELSTQLLEAATPAAPVATAKPPRAPDASAQADHEDRVLNLFLTDGKNLSERKVPGLVGAPNGALEFGTVSATVSGAEFVGLRPLRARRDEASTNPRAAAAEMDVRPNQRHAEPRERRRTRGRWRERRRLRRPTEERAAAGHPSRPTLRGTPLRHETPTANRTRRRTPMRSTRRRT